MIKEIPEYTTKTVLEYTKLYSTLNLLREGSNIVKIGNCNDIGLDSILRTVCKKKGFKYQSLQSGSGENVGQSPNARLGGKVPERSQTDLLQSGGENLSGSSLEKPLPIDLLYLDMDEPDLISEGFNYMDRVRPAGFAVIDNLEDVRMALSCYVNKQNHGAINPIWKVVEDGKMANSIILRRL